MTAARLRRLLCYGIGVYAVLWLGTATVGAAMVDAELEMWYQREKRQLWTSSPFPLIVTVQGVNEGDAYEFLWWGAGVHPLYDEPLCTYPLF